VAHVAARCATRGMAFIPEYLYFLNVFHRCANRKEVAALWQFDKNILLQKQQVD
jgi:hypothetical protein